METYAKQAHTCPGSHANRFLYGCILLHVQGKRHAKGVEPTQYAYLHMCSYEEYSTEAFAAWFDSAAVLYITRCKDMLAKD